MLLADVNFLVAAHREDHIHHHASFSFLKGIPGGHEVLGLCDWTLAGFLRVATHPRIFPVPSPLERALGFTEKLLDLDWAVRLAPGAGHWKIFTALCAQTPARGAFISDVYLAALAVEHGGTLLTMDEDFKRFPGLRRKNPLKS